MNHKTANIVLIILSALSLSICAVIAVLHIQKARQLNDEMEHLSETIELYEHTSTLREAAVTVDSLDALQLAIDAIPEHRTGVVDLMPGVYRFPQAREPIKLRSHVTVRGYGATLLVEDEVPVFVIGPTSENEGMWTDLEKEDVALDPEDDKFLLTQDLVVPALSTDFSLFVADTSQFTPGVSVMIQDELAMEFNEVSEVYSGYITLRERPVNTYTLEHMAQIMPVSIISGACLEGFTIEASYQKKNKYSSFEVSLIQIKRSSFACVRNVSISNLNQNMAGISVHNSEGPIITGVDIKGGGIGILLMQSVSGALVTDCRIHDGSDGMSIGGNRNRIINNLITGSGTTQNSGDGINVGGNASYNLFSGNLIEGGNCYGMWFTVSEYSTGNVIANNTIQANITYGISLEAGSDYIITGNQLQRNSGGIALGSIDGVVVNNNVIIDNLIVGVILNDATRAIITNNILRGNGVDVDPNEVGYDGDIVVLHGNAPTISNNSMEAPLKQLG